MDPQDQGMENIRPPEPASVSSGTPSVCDCDCNCPKCSPVNPFADAERPFRGEIALCLSGGGYRAASFHLGMMQCLHDLDLLERVRIISSLSGGAIISASYAIAQSKGVDFPKFRETFEQALSSNHAMARAFDDLETTERPDEPPSLIRAIANVYASDDFIGPLRLGEVTASEGIADDLIFNATEFRKGLSFRFQHSRRSSFFVGNSGKLRVPQSVADDIRLADIVAASSCFPAAFEPMIFPHDFNWSRPLEEVCAELSGELAKGVPLMDGGIYDNQAVDGTLTAYNRKDMSAGLVLVSDTSARGKNFYQVPERVKRGGLTLRTLNRLGIGFFFASLLSTVALLFRGAEEITAGTFAPWDAVLYGFPVAVCLVLAVVLYRVKRRIKIELARVQEDTDVDVWDSIAQLPVLDLFDMIGTRLQSLISLSSDIFMKRVRGLIATSLNLGLRFRNRAIFNQIYDLDGRNRSIYKKEPWLKPKGHLQALAKRAESMPSVLWFTEEGQLEDLVRCGEITTYFSILEHLLTEEEAQLQDPSSPESKLFQQAKAKFIEFN